MFATSKKNMMKFKLVFVGDQAVGKSSIITRFIKDQFDPTYNPLWEQTSFPKISASVDLLSDCNSGTQQVSKDSAAQYLVTCTIARPLSRFANLHSEIEAKRFPLQTLDRSFSYTRRRKYSECLKEEVTLAQYCMELESNRKKPKEIVDSSSKKKNPALSINFEKNKFESNNDDDFDETKTSFSLYDIDFLAIDQ